MSEREQHEHREGAGGCMITKTEAAGVADVTERTIELWVSNGRLARYTKGPAGYWVRFCRVELDEALAVRAADGGG